jgi:DNA-binding CsgD family transcriptional regulator
VRRTLRWLWLAVRGWPIHRFVALVLLGGTLLPAGWVTVAFGDIWPAGPVWVQVLLAAVQLFPLWWIDRWPVLALAVTAGAFLFAQAFTWPATTADLAVFVALASVGGRTRPGTALASAGVVALAIAGFMTMAQVPAHPEAMVQAILPAAVIVAVPLLAGMTFAYSRRGPAAASTATAGAPVSVDSAVSAGSPDGAELSAAAAAPSGIGARLTARELTILHLIAEGLTNTEIAAKLTIGRETVKTHVSSILVKLGARDRTHAVTMAYRSRMLDDR